MSRAIDLLRAQEAGLPLGESHPDAFLVCFPLRTDWERATGWRIKVEPFPAPLHTSNQPCDHPAPQPVSDLAQLAGTLGWECVITHAHGWVPHARLGTPSVRPKSLWAVRLQRGDQRAVGVRTDGSWSAFWTWSPRRTVRRPLLLDEFRALLLGEDW